MDKFWLKSYPPDIPAEIDLSQYQSLGQFLDDSFRKFADRKAYISMGKAITFADIDAMSKKLAAWLQTKGLQKGTRVAIMMPNVLQYPVALAGLLRAGYIVVNVNPLYTARELEHQLIDSGAEAIIILENFAHTLEQVIAKTQVKQVIVASMGEMMGAAKGLLVNLIVRHVKKLVPAYRLPGAVSFNKVMADAARMNLRPVPLTQDDIAFLQYTGGTTGVAKGATLLHRNVLANLLQADLWLRPGLDKAPKVEQEILICALPLYHIFALLTCFFLSIRVGACNVMIANPRDIPGFVKTLSKYRFNMLPAVNTLFNALLNNPEFAKLDFSGLKLSIGGGMAVQKVVADHWKQVTGCPIAEGYGLSETSPVVSCNLALTTEYTGTIGLPFPSTEVVILDDKDRPLPVGEAGEIAVRGPQVMAGYWRRPDETAKVMTTDGFFKTGDIGIMDERGFIRIVDRKKDMILVSGFNVYPNEIESVVAEHRGVLECACVGVPDPHSGEAVKLYVVRKDPGLTAEQLMAYCKQQFTGYKRPRFIEFRDTLPKTNVGKILRRELRDEKPAVAVSQPG
ncbi:long-chain acyl-CoA synthetase [Paucimonas lemoignei]|uniref:Long-chain-fatty-acid--CoA ligase n=1 Tax=Paucimonas lemoignei TaxID=29443 RepID=A0A4R3HRF6_PAULE|nr:long-chain-fatty-acid--CoA ligase [Paucimonas lemoignei]TCS33544.1 long-chain acyl-CoA synthetase [Paucimonas lemoignei]